MSSKWCHANDTLRLQRRIRWSLFFSTMMVRRTNGLFHYDRKGWTKSMWKLFNLLALCMMVLWVSACNGTDSPNNDQANDQNKQTHQQENKISTEPLKVEIEMPDQLPVKQEIVLKARLTQGNEPVNDAQEVEFEVWTNQKKQSEMINGSLEKDGVYTAKKNDQLPRGWRLLCTSACNCPRDACHAGEEADYWQGRRGKRTGKLFP